MGSHRNATLGTLGTLAVGGLVALAGLTVCPPPAWAAKKGSLLPMPEMVVVRTDQPPVIDGKIAPGEWDRAAACTGFVRAFQGELARLQTVGRMTFDDRYIYVAFTNSRGAAMELLQKRGRRNDDDGVVFDPSNEVWISPPGLPATTYQTLMNSYPAVLDVKMIPSLGSTSVAWQGKWEIASSESMESWTVEARAPIASFGFDRIEDGAKWRALLTANVFQDGEAFRAWAPGEGFADIARHGHVHFRVGGPAFQLLNVESIFTGKAEFAMALSAPREAGAKATVRLRFGGGVATGEGDLLLSREVEAAAGQRVEFTMGGDLWAMDLPTANVVIDSKAKPEVKKECKTGFCSVEVVAADGTVLYTQTFPFFLDGFERKNPSRLVTNPYPTPFGVRAMHAPLSKKLVVKIDRLYMEGRERVAGGRVRLLDPRSGAVLAERAISPFFNDYAEFPLDVSAVSVPIETEEEWAKGNAARAENQRISAENKERKKKNEPPLPPVEVPSMAPGVYTLETVLTAADGSEVAGTAVPVEMIGYEFEWQNNTIGISDRVIPPWTPMVARGSVVEMWNKRYELDALGVARAIVNGGEGQLAGPMRLVAVIDGQEVEVVAEAPKLTRASDAAVELSGKATAGELVIQTTTRVEFDGFVHNTMRLGATRSRVDALSLVVTMPESEAPCMVTTSGGWASYHGWTPRRWDSRDTSLGSMNGNFVPYVLLTDSYRGFQWLADNDRGWLLDPAKPTVELQRKDGKVTLRVNFVNRGEPIAQPTTLEYGWLVTPQKPMPPGWRATVLNQSRPAPEATAIFWNNADWAVVWPYYSSPFPWNYDTSRSMLQRAVANGVRPMVGNIAHAIGRYQDYKGRQFRSVAADWASRLGEVGDGKVARSKGPTDFQLWHWNRWVELSGLPGIYFDENYLGEDWNFLTGGAYLLPDERVQPGYSYLDLREYNKRLRYMFESHGKKPPYLWLHTTGGHPVYAWMPDLAMEAENVVPPNKQNDYIDYLPDSRIRAIGMGHNLGAAPIIMCQAQRHANPDTPFLAQQLVGWTLLHDVLPEQVISWHTMMPELQMWRDDIRFLPYWMPGRGVEVAGEGVRASAHVRPGHAVLWIMNTARADATATVTIDAARLGLDLGQPMRVFDAVTGEAIALAEGRRIQTSVPARGWRAVRLMNVQRLSEGRTFVAGFDEREAADEALGNLLSRPRGEGWGAASGVEGRSGRAVSLDTAIAFESRLHLSARSGRVAMQVRFDPAKDGGTLVSVGDLRLAVNKGTLTVHGPATATTDDGKLTRRSDPVGKADLSAGPARPGDAGSPGRWHAVEVAWSGKAVRVSLNGQEVFSGELAEPVRIPEAGQWYQLNEKGQTTRQDAPAVTFGPLKGAALDDLTMSH